MLDAQVERIYEALADRHFGKFAGIVTDNQDPQARGRVEVQVVAVMGEQRVWALPCLPFAGENGAGFFAVPDVGSNVWVEFEAGDRNHPIWTGCFWPSGAIDAADGKPGVKFWKTKSFSIRIDDDAGEMVIAKTDGGKITITGSEVTIEANTVTQKSGAKKTTLTQASFDVFDGALKVV